MVVCEGHSVGLRLICWQNNGKNRRPRAASIMPGKWASQAGLRMRISGMGARSPEPRAKLSVAGYIQSTEYRHVDDSSSSTTASTTSTSKSKSGAGPLRAVSSLLEKRMRCKGLYKSFYYVTIQFSINVSSPEFDLSDWKNRQHCEQNRQNCEQNRQFINEMLERKTRERSSRLGSGLSWCQQDNNV